MIFYLFIVQNMNYMEEIEKRIPNIGEFRPSPSGFSFPHEKYDNPKRLKHFYHIIMYTRVE